MWIRRVLNDRLYELPPGVSLLVREGVRRASARGGLTWTSGECAAVVGARALLAEHSEQSGIVKLADASCHWWILRETTRPRARRPTAREWAATGYCGLLHRGEILEHAVGLQGAQRLGGMFKIRLGSQRVVVLVEPDDPAADAGRRADRAAVSRRAAVLGALGRALRRADARGDRRTAARVAGPPRRRAAPQRRDRALATRQQADRRAA